MNQTQLIWFAVILLMPYIPLKIVADYRRSKWIQSDECLVQNLGMTRLEIEELNRKYGGT